MAVIFTNGRCECRTRIPKIWNIWNRYTQKCIFELKIMDLCEAIFKWPPKRPGQFRRYLMFLRYYLLTYAGSIGHRPRNATVYCPWPSSQFHSWCIPSPSFLFPCLFARCFVAYLFVSSLGGSMWWLDGWWCLVVSWVYVLSTSIFSSLFHFLWVVAWSFSRV